MACVIETRGGMAGDGSTTREHDQPASILQLRAGVLLCRRPGWQDPGGRGAGGPPTGTDTHRTGWNRHQRPAPSGRARTVAYHPGRHDQRHANEQYSDTCGRGWHADPRQYPRDAWLLEWRPRAVLY